MTTTLPPPDAAAATEGYLADTNAATTHRYTCTDCYTAHSCTPELHTQLHQLRISQLPRVPAAVAPLCRLSPPPVWVRGTDTACCCHLLLMRHAPTRTLQLARLQSHTRPYRSTPAAHYTFYTSCTPPSSSSTPHLRPCLVGHCEDNADGLPPSTSSALHQHQEHGCYQLPPYFGFITLQHVEGWSLLVAIFKTSCSG